MLEVKKEWDGKVDFDFGSEIGTRTLSNKLPQALLQRVSALPNGSDFVAKKKDDPKKEKEVTNVES
jgi:hypothetical protein